MRSVLQAQRPRRQRPCQACPVRHLLMVGALLGMLFTAAVISLLRWLAYQ